MNPKYLYLTLDILSILLPLAFSFNAKAPFYTKWKYLWLSTLIPFIIFIVWDEFFTRLGVWGFNPKYLVGIYVFHLPLEEILFFLCIPYACMFTYFILNHHVEKDHLFPHQELISSALILILLILGIHHIHQLYTGVTFLSLGFFLTYQMLKIRPRYMGRFYFAFMFLLIPFFFINGILTGSFIDEPVVWYNDQQSLGFRLGTIPIEDTFFGMLLILMNVSIFEWLQERDINK